MRSKLVICAALAGACLSGAWAPSARAADPKGKSAKGGKAKAGGGLTDDQTISKQMQWEDSVMGPDDKRAELDKIARAQAINKAAVEKAARDKEKADAAAAKEAANPRPQSSKRGGEVALPSVSDEAPKKVETAEAPPPPTGQARRRQVHRQAAEGRAGIVEEAHHRRRQGAGRSIGVGKPSATKPKRRTTSTACCSRPTRPADAGDPRQEGPARVGQAEDPVDAAADARGPADRPQERRRRDSRRSGRRDPGPRRDAPPSRTQAVANHAPAGNNRQGADGSWNDPFAEAPKKTVAARETRHSSDFDDDFTPRRRPAPAAATRPAARSDDFDDPPKEAPKAVSGSRRAAPAAKPANRKWKDPFTEDRTVTKPAHTTVAAHAPKAAHGLHGVQLASAEGARGWGVLKKHR